MTTRTTRLIGKALGNPASPATITVNFNNTLVYSGTVPTSENPNTPGPISTEILCEWETDSTLSGNIPVSILITGGILIVDTIVMNNWVDKMLAVKKSNAVWPASEPANWEAVTFDVTELTEEEFTAKYELDRLALAANFDWSVDTPKDSYFVSPNHKTALSDGKDNIKINGVERIRTTQSDQLSGKLLGNWSWRVPNDGTLEFDFAILPGPRLL